MKAREIMTENPRVVTPDTSVQEAARMMQSEDTGVLPVVEAANTRRLVGVLTDRDIAIRVVAEGRNGAVVRDVMSPSVRTCRADDNVEDVMRVMSDEQIRRIPIVDESGVVDWVRTRLADYKKPRHVELVDELPRDPNGKVVKRKLRDDYVAALGSLGGAGA